MDHWINYVHSFRIIFNFSPIFVAGYLSGLPGLPPPGGGHPGGPPLPAAPPPRQVHPGLPPYPPGQTLSLNSGRTQFRYKVFQLFLYNLTKAEGHVL